MSIWIDKKFITEISHNLRNFKWKSGSLANCSCPECGDSKIKKRSARGFFYVIGDGYNYMCHNCNYSVKFPVFMKDHFPLTYKEYALESYRESRATPVVVATDEPLLVVPVMDIATRLRQSSVLGGLAPISSLVKSHPARSYIENRKIPLVDIFYSHHYFQWANIVRPDKGYSEKTIQERIIFPFRDINGKFNGYAARSLHPDDQPKYYNYKLEDAAVFGLERVNLDFPVRVVEGPIDSLFAKNCVAASCSALHTVKGIPKEGMVLIPDKDIRNKEIMSLVDKWIKEGYNVCMLPESFHYKDFNDAIIDGLTKEDIESIISNNTFTGLTAKLKFNMWRKDI